jgi:hypothetical protein
MKAKRFAGLELSQSDRKKLKAMQAGGARLSARTWRRIRVLLLLDEGLSVRAAAKAVGSYPRETSRVGKRYLEGDLERALKDDWRPRQEPMLDSTQEAAIVAMVCGPAPDGRARWTVRLTAEEAVRRGVVPQIGRETVRVVLAEHGLKPWREKNVVRAGNRQRVRRADGGRPAPVRPPLRRG